MKKLLFFFALTGWIASIAVHVLSLFDVDVRETVPFVFILHIGIFIVWLPAILAIRNNPEYIEYKQSGLLERMNPFGFYKIVFKNTPPWLKLIAISGFVYAIINFFLFISTMGGVPAIHTGHYELQNHGQLIRTLTEKEYHYYKANEVRGFSGHWMAFYGMATAILFPFSINKDGVDR